MSRVLLSCSLLAAGAACTQPPPVAPNDAGFVHWIGLDSRPLAVGSRIVVTPEIASDAGSPPPFIVTSTNAAVVSVSGLDGGERILLQVVGAGDTTLTLRTAAATSELAVSAAVGVAVQIWDAEHYAIDFRGPLNPNKPLELLANSEELLQGVVLGANCQPLNSWGLIQTGKEALVSPQLPEQFILAPGTIASGPLNFGLVDAGVAPSDAGAVESGCDAGSFVSFNTVSFSNVSVVSSIASAQTLQGYSDGLVVVAEAFASDNTQVYGVNDWAFSCMPQTTCVVTPFSPSVAGLIIPSNSGTHTVTASSPSQLQSSRPLNIP